MGGAILTDSSKTFDCIDHDWLFAQYAAYGFSYESLNFIRIYLTDWKQSVRSIHTWSSYLM